MPQTGGKRREEGVEYTAAARAGGRSRVPGLWVVAYVLVLALPLLRCAGFAWHETSRQAEFAQAGDAFGYFQMAQDIRRGSAPHRLPRFTVDSPHARLALAFLREEGIPVENNGFVGPNAYHYVSKTDQIICQYPPGVGVMLSVFPAGRALFSWQVLTMAAVLALAGWGIFRALKDQTPAALLAAGCVCLMAQTVLLMLGLAISFSVDMLCLPMVIAIAAAVYATGWKRQWIGCVLALVAGAAMGWTVVIRIAAGLFVPGFLPFLGWHAQEEGKGGRWWAAARVAAFGAGILLAGAWPLMVHQAALTGSAFQSTYTPGDASRPTLSSIGPNLEFYFSGGGSGMAVVLLPGIIMAGLWLAAAYLMKGRNGPRMWGVIWTAAGLALWLVVPTGYFLAHTIATQYYQFPTYVVFLTGLAFVAMRWSGEREQREAGARSARGISFAGAAVAAVAVLFMTWSLPALGDDQAFAMPDVTLPEALRDPDAWIVGDRFVGTLWHYHGIVGQQIRELAPAKRAAFYRFVAQRGEPLYLLWDNQALDPVAAEMMAAGARLTEVGSFVRRKVFRVEWPAGVSDAPK